MIDILYIMDLTASPQMHNFKVARSKSKIVRHNQFHI